MDICQKRRERVREKEASLEHPGTNRRYGAKTKCLLFVLVGLLMLAALLPSRAFLLGPDPGLLLADAAVLVVLGCCIHHVLAVLDGGRRYFRPHSPWAVAITVLFLALLDARLQNFCTGWVSGRLPGLRESGARVVFLAPNALVPLLLGLVYDGRAALGLGLVAAFALSVGVVADVAAGGTAVPAGEAGLVAVCAFLAAFCPVCIASRDAPGLSDRRGLRDLAVRTGLLQTPLVVIVAVRLNGGFPGVAMAAAGSLLVLYLELAVSSVVAIDILRRPFENLAHRVSSFTLTRYADLDNPLLRRLAREAPGTYHHSITVGDLVHNAALAIGANALLARTGAYYHDVGKLEHPFYFTENQSGLDNPHDSLPPDISRMIIMNHVKTGVEMARYHHFPAVLARFIATHHGTTILVWFRDKAKERLARLGQAGRNGEAIDGFYRYPGPLPVTREESVLMLADSVEAASRSLKVYDRPAIERLVREIVKAKWLDGQLDESELTNAERAIVVESFITTLVPLLHGRLPYPSQSQRK